MTPMSKKELEALILEELKLAGTAITQVCVNADQFGGWGVSFVVDRGERKRLPAAESIARQLGQKYSFSP